MTKMSHYASCFRGLGQKADSEEQKPQVLRFRATQNIIQITYCGTKITAVGNKKPPQHKLTSPERPGQMQTDSERQVSEAKCYCKVN